MNFSRWDNKGAMAMMQRFPLHALSNAAPGAPLFAIRLIDRRTGEVPRLNGKPISFLTATPRQAVEDLLKDRDRSKWIAQVDPVGLSGQAPETAGLGRTGTERPN